MLLRETVFIAIRALRSNKLRSVLTMLGLVIGVAAVIVLVSAGQGVSNSVNEAISTVANNITVVPQTPSVPVGRKGSKPLTEADLAAVAKAPDVALITPLVSGSTFGAGGEAKHAVTVGGRGKEFLSAQITGTAANWFQSNNRKTRRRNLYRAKTGGRP